VSGGTTGPTNKSQRNPSATCTDTHDSRRDARSGKPLRFTATTAVSGRWRHAASSRSGISSVEGGDIQSASELRRPGKPVCGNGASASLEREPAFARVPKLGGLDSTRTHSRNRFSIASQGLIATARLASAMTEVFSVRAPVEMSTRQLQRVCRPEETKPPQTEHQLGARPQQYCRGCSGRLVCVSPTESPNGASSKSDQPGCDRGCVLSRRCDSMFTANISRKEQRSQRNKKVSTNSRGSSTATRGRRGVRSCVQVPLSQHRLALRPVLTITPFGDSILYHSPVALELYSTSKSREGGMGASAGRDAQHFAVFVRTVRPSTKQKYGRRACSCLLP